MRHRLQRGGPHEVLAVPRRKLSERKDERTRHINRLKGLLANQGAAIAAVDASFPEKLDEVRLWDGSELAVDRKGQLLRPYARWQFVDRQLKDLEGERNKKDTNRRWLRADGSTASTEATSATTPKAKSRSLRSSDRRDDGPRKEHGFPPILRSRQ